MANDLKGVMDRALTDIHAGPALTAAVRQGYLRRQRHRRLGVRVGAGVAVAASAALIWSAAGGSPSSGGVSRLVPAAPSQPAYRNVSVNCGGPAPISARALAQPGHAEQGSSMESKALRNFLAHNPYEGMGTVPDIHWLLLSETPNELIFGHREGAVGVGPVIRLVRKGGQFVASGLSGCSSVLVEKGRSSHRIDLVSAVNTNLSVMWTGGACSGVPAEREVRIEAHESAGAVHLLLVTEPNPASATIARGCLGTGFMATARLRLAAPLGNRVVYDDASIEPKPVQVRQLAILGCTLSPSSDWFIEPLPPSHRSRHTAQQAIAAAGLSDRSAAGVTEALVTDPIADKVRLPSGSQPMWIIRHTYVIQPPPAGSLGGGITGGKLKVGDRVTELIFIDDETLTGAGRTGC